MKKLLLVLFMIYPGLILSKGCSKEEKKVAKAKEKVVKEEKKLKKCMDKKKGGTLLTSKELYTKLWTAKRADQIEETKEMNKRHNKEWEEVIKKSGYDPRKSR